MRPSDGPSRIPGLSRTFLALLAVAGAAWPILYGRGSGHLSDLRERIGHAIDLGPHGRFDRVRERGGGAPALRELQTLAWQTDIQLGRARTRSALSSAALLRAAAGQTDAAIGLLEEAASTARSDAGLATDRAALYLHRAATKQGQPGDAARALQLTGEALAAGPSPEAQFNRAAALEALGLLNLARQAWGAYLNRDRTSPWRQEAQTRLARLGTRPVPARARDVRSILLQAAWTGVADLATEVARDPMQARLLVEEELLGSWARAAERGDPDEADRLLLAARSLAAALRARQADALLIESVAAIEGAARDRRALLVAGHLAYQDGIARMERDEWPAAAEAFDEARRHLEGGRSPFAACALLQSGVCAYYQPDYPAALAAFERAHGMAGRNPVLRARAGWLSGLVRFVTGRSFDALREHQEAREIFARTGEGAHAAFLDSLIAADFQALGRGGQAWESRLRAVRGLDEIAEPRRVFSVLWECARVLLDDDQPWAARDFLSELAERTELMHQPDLRASTLVRRARVTQRLGDWSSATADTAEARRLLPLIPQPLAGRIEADLRVAEAETAAARDPAAAIRAYSDALMFLDGAGNVLQSATLLRGRSAALRRSGLLVPAEGDLERILASFEAGRLRLSEDSQRTAYYEILGGVGDDLIALQLDAGRPWSAFETAERTRRGSLEKGGARAHPTGRRQLQARLPAGTVLLEYAVLPDHLVVWIVTGRASRVVVWPLSAPELQRRVERCLRALLEFDEPNTIEALTDLHEILIAPAAAWMNGAEQILVVADKMLHRVPFAALRDRTSGRYLVERTAVVMAPSASSISFILGDRPDPPQGALVVVSAAPPGGWPALPAAAGEGRQIAALYARGFLTEGRDATPPRVIAALPRYDVLHVAAHSVSGRGFRPAGLLLSPDPAGLHVLDAAALPSTAHLRVAVLASCRTAAGASSLEGPLSLARAFLAAGTPAVIAALWDLPDAASAPLVIAIHRQLAQGIAPAEALRFAQTEAIRSGGSAGNPASWAGLALIGTRFARVLAQKPDSNVRLKPQREGKE